MAWAPSTEVGKHQQDVICCYSTIEVDVPGAFNIEHALAEVGVPHRANSASGLSFGDEALELVTNAVAVCVVIAVSVAVEVGVRWVRARSVIYGCRAIILCF